MAIYTVHHPARSQAGILNDPDATRFVKEGFAWGAFFTGPLWLALRGLWLASLGYVILVVSASVSLHALEAPAGALATLLIALHLLLGFEGNDMRRARLERRNVNMAGVAVARSLNEAERRFFDALLREGSAAEPDPRPAPAQPAHPLPALAPSNPVGFFPAPGGPA